LKLTEQLERVSKPIWDAIFSHPYVRELGRGTLSREQFLHFIRQDWLYLQDFARVLCLLASKADDPNLVKMFAEHAAFAVEVETSTHPKFAASKGLSARELRRTKRGPITQAYSRHLLAVAHEGTFAELLAAVLPCYWTYFLVGKKLAKSVPRDRVYAKWINLYASKDFAKNVNEVLNLVNRLAHGKNEKEKNEMIENYVVSLRYEYLFWDQAYNRDQWPL